MALGHLGDARQISQKLTGSRRPDSNLRLAMATSDWSLAESLAVTLKSDPTVNSGVQFRAKLVHASVQAARGKIEEAAQVLERLAQEAPSPGWARVTHLALAQLSVVHGGMLRIAVSPVRSDTTAAGLFVQGIQAAVLRDAATATHHLQDIRRTPPRDRSYLATEIRFLEAWIAAKANEWEEVIALLEPATTRGQHPLLQLTGPLPLRWLVAEAYERLGRLDQAATAFALVLSPTRMYNREDLLGFSNPFAHHRLVLLSSKMGRVEDARRHWEIFEKTFTNPDPELVPMVEEAREALAAAEEKS
jgi:tetratricopeptide (TPR) repeat protein